MLIDQSKEFLSCFYHFNTGHCIAASDRDLSVLSFTYLNNLEFCSDLITHLKLG